MANLKQSIDDLIAEDDRFREILFKQVDNAQSDELFGPAAERLARIGEFPMHIIGDIIAQAHRRGVDLETLCVGFSGFADGMYGMLDQSRGKELKNVDASEPVTEPETGLFELDDL